MFCPNCGAVNADGAVFCEKCGAKLVNDQPSDIQNTAYAQNTYAPAAPVARVQAPRSNDPVLNAVKNVGASPLFLVAIIAFSASLFFSLISLIGGSYGMLGYLNSYLNRFGIGSFNIVFSSVYRYFALFSFIFMIPTIIYTIGMWITFVGANSRRSNSMSTSGLTMIKVMQIISLVFFCIIFAIIEIALIVGIIAAASTGNDYSYGYSYGYSSSTTIAATAVLIGLLIGVLIGFVLSILYRVKIISSISAVKKTISTGNPAYRASGFVAVMNFIAAASSIILLFFGNFLSILSGLCEITALVCFALVIFKYNNALRSVTPAQAPAYGYPQAYNNNPYPQNQYPGNGYGQM